MKNSKRELILLALLTYPTIREAAASVGVQETTVYNWLKKPDFKTEYDIKRRQMVEATTGYLQTKMSAAAETIHDIMTDESNPPQTRLSAARTLLEVCYKAIRATRHTGAHRRPREQIIGGNCMQTRKRLAALEKAKRSARQIPVIVVEPLPDGRYEMNGKVYTQTELDQFIALHGVEIVLYDDILED